MKDKPRRDTLQILHGIYSGLEKAVRKRKVFYIGQCYSQVRNDLKKKGWVETKTCKVLYKHSSGITTNSTNDSNFNTVLEYNLKVRSHKITYCLNIKIMLDFLP